MNEEDSNKARLLKKAILMGGCPILIMLGLIQLTPPSLIQQATAQVDDNDDDSMLRGRTRYHDFETEKAAGFWTQKLQRLEDDHSKSYQEQSLFDATDDFLFPDEFATLNRDKVAAAPVLHDDETIVRHRRLQVSDGLHNPQEVQQQQPQQGEQGPQQRPIMYTFYEAIEGTNKGTGMSDEADQKLIQVWKEEWTRHGWDPRVIGLETAQQHPDYTRLNAMLGSSQMKVYDRYCFLRYLAMNVVSGGWMSDYDTFPLHPFDSLLPNEGRLTVHEYSKNGGVPDLVSGSAQEFHRIAHLLVENANAHSEAFWSDMLALHDMYVTSGGSIYVRDRHVMPGQVITRQTKADKVCKRTDGKYAVHFSHYAMEFGGNKQGTGPEQRAEVAQTWLKEWRATCLTNGRMALG